MAIATYTQLQTAVGNWLHRADLSSQIPDFISLAESRLNRRLNLRIMEVNASLTATPGSRSITLPTDMVSPIALWLETWQPRQKLQNMLPEAMQIDAVTPGVPVAWAIENAQIAFQRPADQAYALTFRYRRKLALSDAAPTNDLLSQYPDAYLYATLLEAAPYLRDNPNVALWQDRLDRAVNEINSNDAETRALAPLVTEFGLTNVGRRRFNINAGY